MTALAAIRTHVWGEDEERLLAQLRPVFGDDLAVVFHNRPVGLTPPLPVVDLTDDWVAGQGLRILPDYGWRCGDYSYYALRAAHPGYDHYWLIEPDVWFSADPAPFFAAVARAPEDLLAVQIAPMEAGHRFARGLDGMALYKSIFALNRFSGRALDRLFDLRRAYSAGPVGARFFANDEVFCFSHVLADPDLTAADFSAYAPVWFDPLNVANDPDILLDLAQAQAQAQGGGASVFHPVRGRGSFCRALAARMSHQLGFVAKLKPSLDLLTDAEIAAICDDLRARTDFTLRALRRRARRQAATQSAMDGQDA